MSTQPLCAFIYKHNSKVCGKPVAGNIVLSKGDLERKVVCVDLNGNCGSDTFCKTHISSETWWPYCDKCKNAKITVANGLPGANQHTAGLCYKCSGESMGAWKDAKHSQTNKAKEVKEFDSAVKALPKKDPQLQILEDEYKAALKLVEKKKKDLQNAAKHNDKLKNDWKALTSQMLTTEDMEALLKCYQDLHTSQV
jgi:hypothetical protein